MPEGEEGRIQWGAPPVTPQWEGSWENGGPEGERIWRPLVPAVANGAIVTDSQGNRFQYDAGQVGGENHGAGAGYKHIDDAAWGAMQQQAAAGPSTAYDFNKYGYTTDVNGLPTLAADTFQQGLNNPWLAKMYNTADKGSWYQGLGALVGDYQNLGALRTQGGNADPLAAQNGLDYSDATYKQLASFMGIDPNQANYKDLVKQQAENYAMVKGMGGYNPNDPRQVNQILYKKQEDGQWAPVLNRAYHEREKGSWWEEGGKYIMVPLGVVGAGLAAGALAGAGAAEGGAAAATAAEGAGAAGAIEGGSTLGASSGAWGAGFGLGGEGGMTAAQALAASEAAGVTGTSGALGMGAYGSGSLGSGYLGTAGTGSLGAGVPGGATSFDTGLTWMDKITNQLKDKSTREMIQKALKAYSQGQQGVSNAYGGGGGGAALDFRNTLVPNDYAKYEAAERMKRALEDTKSKGNKGDADRIAAIIAALKAGKDIPKGLVNPS